MERKSSKEYSVVFFGGGRKVKVMKFAFEDFIFVVSSAADSVGTTLQLTHLVAVPTPNLAELVPSGFSVQNHGFCGGVEHIFPGKTPVFIVNQKTRVTRVTSNRVEVHIT